MVSRVVVGLSTVVTWRSLGRLRGNTAAKRTANEAGTGGSDSDLAMKNFMHRVWLDRHFIRLVWVSLVIALLTICLFEGTSVFLVVNGHEVSGTVFGAANLVALVRVFVGAGNKLAAAVTNQRDQ